MDKISQENFATLIGKREAFYVTPDDVTNGGATTAFAECSDEDADALRAALAMVINARISKVAADALLEKAERVATDLDELSEGLRPLVIADYAARGVPVEAVLTRRAETARVAAEAAIRAERIVQLAQANAAANLAALGEVTP